MNEYVCVVRPILSDVAFKDPESLAGRGPIKTTFLFCCFFMRRERIQVPLKAGHHRPASERPLRPFEWHFACEPMTGVSLTFLASGYQGKVGR